MESLKTEGNCYELRKILMNKVVKTVMLLKKTVRDRKVDRFVKFAEKLVEKPIGELLKLMSNIRRKASGLSSASDLSSSPGDLGEYADYFSRFFAAMVPKGKRIDHT